MSEIIERIVLKPSQLTSKYKQHIKNILCAKLKNTCTNEGYILDVEKIISVKQISENTSANVVFNVKCNVVRFRPAINDILTGTVVYVTQHGPLLLVKNVYKIVLPSTKLPSTYKLTPDNKFTHKTNPEETIELQSELKVKLISVKFDKTKFTGICEFVKKI
jgi:DNA-directed RNA polymerase subunit E'/Rpb7